MMRGTQSVDALAAQANFAIDEMLTDVIEALNDGTDPAAFAARLSVLFFKTDPHRSCTLAAYALVRLAQQQREGRS